MSPSFTVISFLPLLTRLTPLLPSNEPKPVSVSPVTVYSATLIPLTKNPFSEYNWLLVKVRAEVDDSAEELLQKGTLLVAPEPVTVPVFVV